MISWGLIVAMAVAVVLVVGILWVGIPYLIRKHFPLGTYMSIMDNGLNILQGFIGNLGLPTKEVSNIDHLIQYAELAVKYAEQLYSSGQLPAAARKEAALTFIKQAAAQAGITLSAGDLVFIDALIEAMVFMLPETVTPVTSGTTPVASGTVPVVSGTTKSGK